MAIGQLYEHGFNEMKLTDTLHETEMIYNFKQTYCYSLIRIEDINKG